MKNVKASNTAELVPGSSSSECCETCGAPDNAPIAEEGSAYCRDCSAPAEASVGWTECGRVSLNGHGTCRSAKGHDGPHQWEAG